MLCSHPYCCLSPHNSSLSPGSEQLSVELTPAGALALKQLLFFLEELLSGVQAVASSQNKTNRGQGTGIEGEALQPGGESHETDTLS